MLGTTYAEIKSSTAKRAKVLIFKHKGVEGHSPRAFASQEPQKPEHPPVVLT